MNGPSECWGVIQENSLRDDRGCLTWLGHVQTKGYGFIRCDGRYQVTMRIVWQHFHGEIPEGMSVMHKCDNRRCCEPRHLMLGTNADNILDKAKKGRARKKLHKEQIPEIRKMLAEGIVSQTEIGRQFGVHQSVISAIKHGRYWAHH
jgi:hypothetical protein